MNMYAVATKQKREIHKGSDLGFAFHRESDVRTILSYDIATSMSRDVEKLANDMVRDMIKEIYRDRK